MELLKCIWIITLCTFSAATHSKRGHSNKVHKENIFQKIVARQKEIDRLIQEATHGKRDQSSKEHADNIFQKIFALEKQTNHLIQAASQASGKLKHHLEHWIDTLQDQIQYYVAVMEEYNEEEEEAFEGPSLETTSPVAAPSATEPAEPTLESPKPGGEPKPKPPPKPKPVSTPQQPQGTPGVDAPKEEHPKELAITLPGKPNEPTEKPVAEKPVEKPKKPVAPPPGELSAQEPPKPIIPPTGPVPLPPGKPSDIGPKEADALKSPSKAKPPIKEKPKPPKKVKRRKENRALLRRRNRKEDWTLSDIKIKVERPPLDKKAIAATINGVLWTLGKLLIPVRDNLRMLHSMLNFHGNIFISDLAETIDQISGIFNKISMLINRKYSEE